MKYCAYDGRIYMSVGMQGTIYVSLDGYHWICKTEWTDTKNDYEDIIWTGERFVILGRDSVLSWIPDDIVKIKVNGMFVKMDTVPVVQVGRTLIPIRAVSEALGAEVEWNGEDRKANREIFKYLKCLSRNIYRLVPLSHL